MGQLAPFLLVIAMVFAVLNMVLMGVAATISLILFIIFMVLFALDLLFGGRVGL